MTKQISFSKYEQKVLPNFRQKISQSESIEDVKKFFIYTVKELLESILPSVCIPLCQQIRQQLPFVSFSL